MRSLIVLGALLGALAVPGGALAQEGFPLGESYTQSNPHEDQQAVVERGGHSPDWVCNQYRAGSSGAYSGNGTYYSYDCTHMRRPPGGAGRIFRMPSDMQGATIYDMGWGVQTYGYLPY